MLKSRFFLVGLGIGLIAGSILLQLMNFASDNSKRSVLDNLNDPSESVDSLEKVRERADQLGYKLMRKDEVIFTKEQLDSEVQKAVEAALTDEQQNEPTTDKPSDQPKTLSITIKTGMGTEQVANQLVDSGIITDKKAFLDELDRLKLANKVQVGTFTFDKKPSISEVIEAITKK